MQKTTKFRNSLLARLLLVFLAFVLMIVSSSCVMFFTLNQKLLANAEATMDDTQVLFSRILREPETLLNLIAGNVEGIYNRNEGLDAIKSYLVECTTEKFKSQVEMMTYYSVFGYFFIDEDGGLTEEGEFFDGHGFLPDEDYDATERPWYIAATAGKGRVRTTSTYIDADTKEKVISSARQIFDSSGNLIGVVSLDVHIEYIRDLVINQRITENSYGYMIDNNYDVIMHVSDQIVGQKFWENSATSLYRDQVFEGQDISLQRTVNYAGENSIVFGRRLDNGWYFVLIVPESEYYGDLYNMVLITGILGAGLAFALMFMLVRIEKARKKSDDREIELLKARATDKLQLAKINLVVRASKIGLWDAKVNMDDPTNEDNPFMWSREFRELLGFGGEEDFPNVIGSFTRRLHPDDLDRTNAAFAAHLLDKTGKTPFDLEYRLQKKNGEYAYFRATGETIRDEEGNPDLVAGAIMDITEMKQTIVETERLRREAEEANKAKSAFLSTMSHEIRTPINAILGITEILLQREDLLEDIEEALGKVYTSGDMLLGIINDILDLSKIEAGRLELENYTYELASLISDTAQLNMMRIGSKPIEFELSVDDNLPVYVNGDELRVKQILNNLLSNAIKYTSEGRIHFSVSSVPADEEGKTDIVFKVSDTGQGMTREQLERLFEAYSRFNQEANRTTEGTGLGMNITNNLIKLMGGEIFVESERGKGSVFTVRIRQGKVGDEVLSKEMVDNLLKFRTTSRAQMKRVQITREPMPYGHVLVVDDVESNLYVAKGLLSPYQLKVDTAESGFAALDKIKSNEYDIVFMDHMMPEMDGIETTKKMRSAGYVQPIVALTANAVAGQAEIFLSNGFDDYISKPIDVRQLNSVLNKLLRDRKPARVVEEARQQAKNKPVAVLLDNEPHMAEVFLRDVNRAIPALTAVVDSNGSCTKEEIRNYVIQAHGIKSALAIIGKMELSAVALKLEALGRDGNINALVAETPSFLRSLRRLIDEISPKDDDGAEDRDEDKEYLSKKLLEVKAACDDFDEKTADDIIAELRNNKCSHETKEKLNSIAEKLLHSDFDEAASIAETYASSL